MPRILSAALNGPELEHAAWTMSIIAHNGLHTMTVTRGVLFSHTRSEIPIPPNSSLSLKVLDALAF